MQSSSIFSIEEIDAAEFLQQEDFNLDFLGKQESSGGSGNISTGAILRGDGGFKKFNFKPQKFNVRSPTSGNTEATPNPQNGGQGENLSIQKWPLGLGVNSGNSTQQGKKCVNSSNNFKKSFQRFDPQPQSCSAGVRDGMDLQNTRTDTVAGSPVSSKLPPSTVKADRQLDQRRSFLSGLANLCSENSLGCGGGRNRVKGTALLSHGVSPASHPVQIGQHLGNHQFNVGAISSTGALQDIKRSKQDLNGDVPVDARRGFRKFQKTTGPQLLGPNRGISRPQFLSPKRTESSPGLSSTGTDRDGNGSLRPRGSSGDSATDASPGSDTISQIPNSSSPPFGTGVPVRDRGSGLLTPSDRCLQKVPHPVPVSQGSIIAPVSGSSSKELHETRRIASPSVLPLDPASPTSGLVPSAATALLPPSNQTPLLFSLGESPPSLGSVSELGRQSGDDSLATLKESLRENESKTVLSSENATSRNGGHSRAEVQTLRTAGVSAYYREGISPHNRATPSPVAGSVGSRLLLPSGQPRLRQISSIRPGVSPSTQFLKKNGSTATPVFQNMQSPVSGGGAPNYRVNASTLGNTSTRLPLPHSIQASPYRSRTPIPLNRNLLSPPENQHRQPWMSPRPGAQFPGQRFTPGRPRTPQGLSTEGFPSPKQPVLTPRVAQLCKTPTGASVVGQTRSSRRFPGPAGILPKLSPGQKLSSIELSPPMDEEEQKEKEEARKLTQSSGQPCVDDFSQGAWATMKAELGLDEGDTGSILAQHTIASVLKKASLKQLHRNKVPHLCVMVKAIALQASDAVVTFHDPSGEMNGTLHRRLLEEYQGDLKPGCVLLLKQVGVLSPSLRNHYLNVTHRNVVQIFPPEHALSQMAQGSTQTSKRTPPKSIRVGKGLSEDGFTSDKENKPSSPPESSAGTSPTNCQMDGVPVNIRSLDRVTACRSGGASSRTDFLRSPHGQWAKTPVPDAPVDNQSSDGATPQRGGNTLDRTNYIHKSPHGRSGETPVSNMTGCTVANRMTPGANQTMINCGGVEEIPRRLGVKSPLGNSPVGVTVGNSRSVRETLHGSGLSTEITQKKRTSWELGRDRDKRVCVESLRGTSSGEKENVSPLDGTVLKAAVTVQPADDTDHVEENIAELIDGFEEELFADF